MQAESKPRFKHRSLNLCEKEIRLVQIVQTHDEAAPVQLRMRHANLSKDLRYNALSYAWGPEHPKFNVYITDEDGAEGIFQVRENLFEFFQAARRPSAHETCFQSWIDEWIWIDQICINQADGGERCHQVNQMGEVYAATTNTIMWPGLMPPLATVAHEFLHEKTVHRWRELRLNSEDLQSILDYTKSHDSSHSRVGDNSGLFADSTRYALLRRMSGYTLLILLRKPYWKRLWILQELFLGRNRTLLFWTTETHSLLEFSYVLLGINTRRRYRDTATINPFEDVVYRLRRTTLSKPFFEEWYEVLVLGGGAYFAEPLDRVYGVMGLLDNSLRLEPDYTLTIEHLMLLVVQKQVLNWPHLLEEVTAGKETALAGRGHNLYWRKLISLLGAARKICGYDWMEHTISILSQQDAECLISKELYVKSTRKTYSVDEVTPDMFARRTQIVQALLVL